MVRRTLLLVLAPFLVLSDAERLAADGAPGTASASVPTRGDADACEADVHRLCNEFFPDEKLIATCLVDKRAQLSVACAEVLARPAAPDQGADAK